MNSQLFAVVFLGLISFSYSQITSAGQCEDRTKLKPVENFSLEKYANNAQRWYTIFTYNTPADCEYVNFTLTSNVTVDFFWIRKNLTTGGWIGRDDGIVTWTPESDKLEGIISAKFPNVSAPLVHPIIGIDYVGYDMDYRCINLTSSSRMEWIWVRSRARNFTAEQAATVKQILVDNGIDDLTPTYAVQDEALCSE